MGHLRLAFATLASQSRVALRVPRSCLDDSTMRPGRADDRWQLPMRAKKVVIGVVAEQHRTSRACELVARDGCRGGGKREDGRLIRGLRKIGLDPYATKFAESDVDLETLP